MDSLRHRIAQYCSVDPGIWQEFESLPREECTFLRGIDVVRQGQPAHHVYVIAAGWLIRFRMLKDGRRQITNFMLPGDIFDLQALADLQADHSIRSLTPVTCFKIKNEEFLALLRRSGALASAFWWAAVQEESILREQIVRIGRRSALERIGHLLLELHRRLTAVTGEGTSRDLPLPVTRAEIADALGLTPVHVSRTMSAMRKSGIIDEGRGVVSILDRDRLANMAHFDDDYLHFRKLDFDDGNGGSHPKAAQ